MDIRPSTHKPPASAHEQVAWSERFADRLKSMRSSAVRELLKITAHPEVISFAGGLPAPDLFPVERFQEACRMVLLEHGRDALQYGPTEGYEPLRELVARHASRYTVTVRPENVLITSGSQQGLDLLGKIFINPGDLVLVEQPTYLGALQAWRAYQASFYGISSDRDGLRTAELETALTRRPKFIYVQPNYRNPTGTTLTIARRRALVRLARDAGIPIIEDDPYGQLSFDEEPPPTLLSLDAGLGPAPASCAGNVVCLGTFSKLLSPGLRLGWIIAPVEVIERLVLAKQGTDLHTSTLAQMVAHRVARGGFLDQHVRRLRKVYRQRRDAMLASLSAHFPEGVEWTHPAGGLFLWVTLPEGIDARELLQQALAENVAFVPGQEFFADGTGCHTLRLNFSFSEPLVIEEGIRRLGRVVHRAVRAHRPATVAT